MQILKDICSTYLYRICMVAPRCPMLPRWPPCQVSYASARCHLRYGRGDEEMQDASGQLGQLGSLCREFTKKQIGKENQETHGCNTNWDIIFHDI